MFCDSVDVDRRKVDGRRSSSAHSSKSADRGAGMPSSAVRTFSDPDDYMGMTNASKCSDRRAGFQPRTSSRARSFFFGTEGVVTDKPLPFFLQRYAEAYRRELDHFITAVSSGAAPRVGAKEGIRALALADAGAESARTGQAV
jgi:predicted dehydrogenase